MISQQAAFAPCTPEGGSDYDARLRTSYNGTTASAVKWSRTDLRPGPASAGHGFVTENLVEAVGAVVVVIGVDEESADAILDEFRTPPTREAMTGTPQAIT